MKTDGGCERINDMAFDNPKVGIALLNWNQYDDTAPCLASLRESQYRPASVLVYDNGSTDGSAVRLKTEFPEIQLVEAGHNYGFGEGNSRAVEILLDGGMDLVWGSTTIRGSRPIASAFWSARLKNILNGFTNNMIEAENAWT